MKPVKYAVILTHKEGGHKTLIKDDGDEFPWTHTMFKVYIQKMWKKFPGSFTFCTWPPKPWTKKVKTWKDVTIQG